MFTSSFSLTEPLFQNFINNDDSSRLGKHTLQMSKTEEILLFKLIKKLGYQVEILESIETAGDKVEVRLKASTANIMSLKIALAKIRQGENDIEKLSQEIIGDANLSSQDSHIDLHNQEPKKLKLDIESSIKQPSDILLKKLFDHRQYLANEISYLDSNAKPLNPSESFFSDRTLELMSAKRPLTFEDLQKIEGVTQKKCQQFGSTFLNIIKQHCQTSSSDLGRKGIESSKITLNLFLQGKTVIEIAKIRNFKPTTILSHLALQISQGQDIDISSLVSKEKKDAICKIIDKIGATQLRNIKDQLSKNITYEEIKLVASSYRRNL